MQYKYESIFNYKLILRTGVRGLLVAMTKPLALVPLTLHVIGCATSYSCVT